MNGPWLYPTYSPSRSFSFLSRPSYQSCPAILTVTRLTSRDLTRLRRPASYLYALSSLISHSLLMVTSLWTAEKTSYRIYSWTIPVNSIIKRWRPSRNWRAWVDGWRCVLLTTRGCINVTEIRPRTWRRDLGQASSRSGIASGDEGQTAPLDFYNPEWRCDTLGLGRL